MGYNFIERIIDGKFSLGEDFRQTGRDILSFLQKHQSKILISSLIIIMLGVSNSYLAIGKLNQYMKTPKYGVDFQSIKFRNGICVRFHDDIAPGMRAFIEYDGKEMRMAGTDESADSCDFLLPEEALKTGEFIVYAIDRDGNKSKPKTLYTLEGVVLEKDPN